MIEKLTQDEQIVADLLLNPIAFSEIMFDDIALRGGTFTRFNEKKFSTIRLYQFSFFSFDSMIGEDPKLSKKENFKLKINAGTVYNLSGRGIGKTICEKLNIIHTIFVNDIGEGGIESYDDKHTNSIIEPAKQAYETHPVLKNIKNEVKRGTESLISNTSGFRFYGINGNISKGLQAGDNFFGKHFIKLFIEEFSKENNIIYNKRQEAISDYGVIINASGMCDFLKHSPAGRIFNDISNRKFIVNLPKYVLPTWDDKEEEEAIKRYGDVDDISYKIYILAQPVEEGMSAFDESRIRACYTFKHIKHFEINKDNYENYSLIISPVIRPKNCDSIWIAADIGTSSQTKILIFSKNEDIFYYIYKITLFNIINPQLEPFFDYLIEKLNAEFISVDAGDGDGRNLYWHLEPRYSKEHVFAYDGAKNIAINVKKNELGQCIYTKDGKLEFEYEKMSVWGAEVVKKLFYESKISMPIDMEADIQLTSVVAIPRTSGIVYTVTSDNDHWWNAIKAFGCLVWDKYLFIPKDSTSKDEGYKGIIF